MPQWTIAFLVFAAVAAVTPGPSNILLAGIGATVGIRRGLPALGGVAAGMALLLGLTTAGLGGALAASPPALTGLKLLGSAALGWLAWRIATAPALPDGPDAGDGSPALAPVPAPAPGPVLGFWPAAALQWLNPKAWLVSLSVAGVYGGQPGRSAVGQGALLAVLFLMVALPACWLWLAAGAGSRRLTASPARQRTRNRALGLLLAASVIVMWLG